MTTTHKTLTFSRRIRSSAPVLFSALADPDKRSQWSPPSPEEVVIFTQPNFAVGAIELSTCGPADSPEYFVDTYYVDIVENERIVFCEGVMHGGKKLAASLITMEIAPNGDESQLDIAIQVASFVGDEMIEGYEFGWSAALEGLDRFLAG